MTAAPAPPGPDELDARVGRCRRVVEALTDVGMRLLETLDPARGPATVRDPILAYCRLSRALRLTLLLDLRLDAILAGGAAALAAERALGDTAPEHAADALLDEADAAETSAPAETIRVRLDREAPDEALRYLKRPMAELVAAICGGLELAPDATRLAQAPFAALVANDDGPHAPEAAPAPDRSPTPAPAPRRERPALRGTLGP